MIPGGFQVFELLKGEALVDFLIRSGRKDCCDMAKGRKRRSQAKESDSEDLPSIEQDSLAAAAADAPPAAASGSSAPSFSVDVMRDTMRELLATSLAPISETLLSAASDVRGLTSRVGSVEERVTAIEARPSPPAPAPPLARPDGSPPPPSPGPGAAHARALTCALPFPLPQRPHLWPCVSKS